MATEGRSVEIENGKRNEVEREVAFALEVLEKHGYGVDVDFARLVADSTTYEEENARYVCLNNVPSGTAISWNRKSDGRWVMALSGESKPVVVRFAGVVLKQTTNNEVVLKSIKRDGFATSRRVLITLSENSSVALGGMDGIHVTLVKKSEINIAEGLDDDEPMIVRKGDVVRVDCVIEQRAHVVSTFGGRKKPRKKPESVITVGKAARFVAKEVLILGRHNAEEAIED